MHIRTFQARNMREALDLVRREMGSEALIVSTGTVGTGDSNGPAPGKALVEVVAAVDYELPAGPEGRYRFSRILERVDAEHRSRPAVQPAPPVSGDGAEPREPQVATPSTQQETQRSNRDDLKWMTHFLVRKMVSPGDCPLPEHLVRFSCQMLKQGLAEHLLRKLIGELMEDMPAQALHDSAEAKKNMAEKIKAEFLVSGPLSLAAGRPTIAALVGPTGVGKTTTLAKLAAHHALGMKKRVALVSIDTYRIAAVEQLRIYATIMNLPFQAVSTPEEFRHALERFAGFDLILIDTAGRSQRDRARIEEMKLFLRQAAGIEICLVMSSTHREDTLLATSSQFDLLAVDRIIFTKLDENDTYGNILNHLAAIRKPVSYLTTGQRVPEDIEVATKERLASLILGEAQIQCC